MRFSMAKRAALAFHASRGMPAIAAARMSYTVYEYLLPSETMSCRNSSAIASASGNETPA